MRGQVDYSKLINGNLCKPGDQLVNKGNGSDLILQVYFYVNLMYPPALPLSLSPAAEIDHVSSLFQEKQAELQSAVVRVDQVTWRVE